VSIFSHLLHLTVSTLSRLESSALKNSAIEIMDKNVRNAQLIFSYHCVEV
jgi:hypothetical protein